MGKGFNNYMCKKFFHPGSRDNLKRVWMAQQKTEADKKKQEELKAQYEKEQDLYVNKSLVSKESKEKLSVNFLYEPPPGMKKEREKEDGEPEFKFEWQRKYNAPREDYCRGNDDIRDQPFGIAVRNVRCIKCAKWGHVNTDRECPLFNKARDAYDEAVASVDPSQKLMKDMQESGLAMTRSAINTLEQMSVPMQNSETAKSDLPDADEEMAFLKTLSTKEKKKLLKKLEKLEEKNKKKKKKKKDKKKRDASESPRGSSSSIEEDGNAGISNDAGAGGAHRVERAHNKDKRQDSNRSEGTLVRSPSEERNRHPRSRSRERNKRSRSRDRDRRSRSRDRDRRSRSRDRDRRSRSRDRDRRSRSRDRDVRRRQNNRDDENSRRRERR